MTSRRARYVALPLLLLARAAGAQPAPVEPAAAPVEPAAAPVEPAAAPAEPAAAAPATAEPAAPATAAEGAPPGGLPEGDAEGAFEAVDPAAAAVMVGEETPKLELYGFADFSYLHTFAKQSNVLNHYVGPYPRFYVGHLNLYLSSTLSESWRSLAEVRFTYSPIGDEDRPEADGTFPAFDSTAVDYAELQRTFQYSGIEIQRAWIEYQPFDFLAIRGGQWFTPYGYWNDDHGSPTIIAVHKPFPIGDMFFPERQTGLVAHGKYFFGSTALGYALTLSNGRGPFDALRDLDANKAIGGRLYLDFTEVGNLTIGVDAYRGRFTASTKRYSVDTSGAEPEAVVYRTIDVQYDELSLGADVRWLWNDLHVQAEVMTNEAAYDDDHRPPASGFDPRPTFAADYRRIGGYLLLGYRTPLAGLMPYVMGEHSSYTNTDLAPPAWAWSAGLNLRPTPNVVLKAELALADFVGKGSTGLGKDKLTYFGAQVAWAF